MGASAEGRRLRLTSQEDGLTTPSVVSPSETRAPGTCKPLAESGYSSWGRAKSVTPPQIARSRGTGGPGAGRRALGNPEAPRCRVPPPHRPIPCVSPVEPCRAPPADARRGTPAGTRGRLAGVGGPWGWLPGGLEAPNYPIRRPSSPPPQGNCLPGEARFHPAAARPCSQCLSTQSTEQRWRCIHLCAQARIGTSILAGCPPPP